jgi:hypothetical protein
VLGRTTKALDGWGLGKQKYIQENSGLRTDTVHKHPIKRKYNPDQEEFSQWLEAEKGLLSFVSVWIST